MENEAKGKSIVGAHSIQEFVQKLKKPRRMMMLVMAGKVCQTDDPSRLFRMLRYHSLSTTSSSYF